MIAQTHPVDRDIVIIEADDSINDDVTEQVVADLIGDLTQRRQYKVILDCARLEFLSSFGLSLMLRLRHAVHKAGGEVKISGLSVAVEQMLHISKVSELFRRYVDVNAARTGFLSEAKVAEPRLAQPG